MDAKDFAILRELDINFRQSFSKIGKKVNLSKNSVALRFEKLKKVITHSVVGINNEILGYSFVKVFYTFDFYNDKIEKKIIQEVKKHKNILWAARLYGAYDLSIALLVNNFDDLITQVSEFNKSFASKINQKQTQIVYDQVYLRHNFLHKEPLINTKNVIKTKKRIILSEADKKILSTFKYEPRMNIIDIAEKTGLTSKTVSTRIKNLEKKGVIMGYYMTLDSVKLNFNTFKILIQTQNLEEYEELEKYLKTNKNVRYITRMFGLWDYEIDFVYKNIAKLQNEIDTIKQKFPQVLKKILIISFGKRIVTNKEDFLN